MPFYLCTNSPTTYLGTSTSYHTLSEAIKGSDHQLNDTHCKKPTNTVPFLAPTYQESSTSNHLLKQQKASTSHGVKELYNYSDLDWALHLEPRTHDNFTKKGCLYCPEEMMYVRLPQLAVEEKADNLYSYSLRITHAPSVNYWLHYKKIIDHNLKDYNNLFRILAKTVEKDPHNERAIYYKSRSYTISELPSSDKKILINILSTYLSYGLLAEFEKRSQRQHEVKDISDIFHKSDLTNVFNLFLAIDKNDSTHTTPKNAKSTAPLSLVFQQKHRATATTSHHQNASTYQATTTSYATQKTLTDTAIYPFTFQPADITTATASYHQHASTYQATTTSYATQKTLTDTAIYPFTFQPADITTATASHHQHASIGLIRTASSPIIQPPPQSKRYIFTNYCPPLPITTPPLLDSIRVPIQRCDHCDSKTFTVPSLIYKGCNEIFFERYNLVKKGKKDSEEQCKTKHIIYADITYNSSGELQAIKNKQITLKLANFNDNLLIKINKLRHRRRGYDYICQLINGLKGKALSDKREKVDHQQFEDYMKAIQPAELQELNDHLKIFIGAIIAEKIESLSSTYQSSNDSFSLAETTKISTHASSLSYLLRIMHIKLNTSNNSNTLPPYMSNRMKKITRILTHSYSNTEMSTISVSTTSFTVSRYQQRITSENFSTAFASLKKSAPWHIPSDETSQTLYCLCLPFSTEPETSEKMKLILENTNLSLVTLDESYLEEWNSIFRSCTQEAIGVFMKRAARFLLPKKFPNSIIDDDEFNAIVSVNKAELASKLKLLIGIKYALTVYSSVSIKTDEAEKSCAHINTYKAKALSEAICNDTVEGTLIHDKYIKFNELNSRTLKGYGNLLLTYLTKEWKHPTANELQSLATQRSIGEQRKRKNLEPPLLRPSKRMAY